MELTRDVMRQLGAAFTEDEIEFLPRGHSNGKACALAYIDARDVMRRLDAVVGPGGWSFDFDPLSADGKMVRGRLTVLGVTKCDAGESDAEDEPLKSAVSDALKRTAVHFGIGRYLYYLPRIWAPYDAQRKQFTEKPRIAPAALNRALAICGVGDAPAPPAQRNEAPPPRPPVQQQVAETLQRQERPVQIAGREAPPVPQPGPHDSPGTGALVCSNDDCGKALTKGQHDVSIRQFGRRLCPACQKAEVGKSQPSGAQPAPGTVTH